ncbi:MAG: hypothetical protein ACU0CQ_17380 [Sulfitobacter sp.]|uniref:hypothetical protein n=1 Tax=Sulfitobacter sp. TaxID=1903071 RepID=UPI0040581C9B
MTAAWVYTLISAAVVTLGYRCGQCAPPPGPTLVSAIQYSAAGVSFLHVLCLEEVMK